MKHFSRLLTAACIAVFSLALFTSAAAALRSITVNRTRVTATSRSVIFEASELNTTCEVTLNGETTVTAAAKRAGTNIGVITEGRTTNCRGAAREARVLNTAVRPIRIQYASFAGTLPRITSVSVTGVESEFLLNTFFGSCLYKGDVPARFSETGGGTRFNQAEFRRGAARLVSGPCGFAPTGTITGTFSLSTTLNVGLI